MNDSQGIRTFHGNIENSWIMAGVISGFVFVIVSVLELSPQSRMKQNTTTNISEASSFLKDQIIYSFVSSIYFFIAFFNKEWQRTTLLLSHS
jgi:hypothetical protein